MKVVMLFVLVCSLWGKSIEAEYRVDYGFFGKVGEAKAFFEENATSYHILTEGRTTGFAKVLSGGIVERYESRGKVVGGKLLPLEFIKSRTKRHKRSVKRFKFDYDKRIVTITKRIYKRGKLVATTHDTLPYFASEDLLTLFFNMQKRLKNAKGTLHFKAVGGDRKSGAVDILIPKGQERSKIKRVLKAEGFYIVVIIHQKIFSSKRGVLYIVLDDTGIAKKAMLKDVIMFGDIVGKLVSKRVYE